MAWTTPGTAVAGDVLTAAFWNLNVRDNTQALKDNVTSLTAAIPTRSTNTGSTTATTSTTFTDTGLSVSITPTATTSLIEVTFNIWMGCSQTAIGSLNLMRGATNIAQGATCTCGNIVTSGRMDLMAATFIDSPATTSATTYKLQWKTSAGTIYLNRRGDANDVNPFSYLQVREIVQ